MDINFIVNFLLNFNILNKRLQDPMDWFKYFLMEKNNIKKYNVNENYFFYFLNKLNIYNKTFYELLILNILKIDDFKDYDLEFNKLKLIIKKEEKILFIISLIHGTYYINEKSKNKEIYDLKYFLDTNNYSEFVISHNIKKITI